MSLYKTGTVSLTAGSNVVTGDGTAFVANVVGGNDFKVSGENAEYNVISVDSDTQIKISPNYAGTTGSGKAYSISRDYTQAYGLTEVEPGDTDWPFRQTQNLRKIDSLIALGSPGGLFQLDEYGALMPVTGLAIDGDFEIDGYGDIQPKG